MTKNSPSRRKIVQLVVVGEAEDGRPYVFSSVESFAEIDAVEYVQREPDGRYTFLGPSAVGKRWGGIVITGKGHDGRPARTILGDDPEAIASALAARTNPGRTLDIEPVKIRASIPIPPDSAVGDWWRERGE
jgi:hypothetical protein